MQVKNLDDKPVRNSRAKPWFVNRGILISKHQLLKKCIFVTCLRYLCCVFVISSIMTGDVSEIRQEERKGCPLAFVACEPPAPAPADLLA